MPSKTFSVSGNGSTVLQFRGHPQYDAIRVDIDSANTSSTSTDLTFKIDSNDEVGSKAFGDLDATVYTATGVDASSSDQSEGTTALGRVVAVEIDETSGSSVEGTVYTHNASDPAQNADAFANR